MRKFKTGATRDDEKDKLDFEGFLSPIVLHKFAQYMHKHRKQADGKLRNSDNWQKGFGESAEEHYKVCMKSLFRHFMDLWLEHRGFASREGVEDALMGCLFNIMAYADRYFKEEVNFKEEYIEGLLSTPGNTIGKLEQRLK